ncbi:heme-binding protein [Caldichromatium japonicum]|uniref:Heme-binding protein n=1 Tax=Caldichromatium japonicum TaxID=2699430 RepID=A0A6G7VE51_9GAMM|nr:heme-binding protein [Caldichromatium japonicum]QIK38353.1 heme-binding protein [Caldichromatium japonicum]
MASEEPSYQVIRQTADYELRRYEPYRVAEVEVRGAFAAVGREGFHILADYIFGDNQGQARIEMTAPVNQRPAAGPEVYIISFIMPSRFQLADLPRPNNPRIILREEPARLIAARRYSGSWSEERYRREEQVLLAAMARDGLKPQGVSIYARYNSPFSIPLLRRNEILVPIEAP